MYLTLDSAIGKGSAAVFDGGKLVSYGEIAQKGQQAAQLVGVIEACLAEAGAQLEDMRTIYCTVGPGGFTGIRIALAAARALSFTKKIELFGVSTLACLAACTFAEKPQQAKVIALLPASRGHVYVQSFSQLVPEGQPVMASVSSLTPDGFYVKPRDVSIFDLDVAVTDVAPIDAKAAGLVTQLANFDAHHKLAPEPLYIRPPDATPQKKIVLN